MATAGPNYTGTVANDASIGSAAWNNPTNAQGNQTTIYAYVDLLNAGAVEYSIKLIKGGTISGTDKSTGATIPTTQTSVNYGGASDLWGLTFTNTDINASNFGVAFAAQEPLAPTISNYLAATNFGFSIPSSSIINGITCSINQLAASAASFVAGTLINTRNGFKKIEQITTNDEVLSFDKNKKTTYQKVNGLISGKYNNFVKINKKIIATDSHLFLTHLGWIHAKDLKEGMYIFTKNKRWSKQKIKDIKYIVEEMNVFNFEVDVNHNYFANNYAVHNAVLVNRYIRVYNFGITVDYTPPGGGSAVQRRRVSAIMM
jgi:hypothetical protein